MTTTQLVPQDLSWCVRRLDPVVQNLLKANAGRIFLAGGYIRSCISREPIADVDLFISSPGDLAKYLRELFGRDPVSPTEVFFTANAATVRQWHPRVQIIHRWTFENAQDGIDRFDFTIARAAIWFDGSTWQSVCDESYYSDLAAKRIVYCAPRREEEPGGSLLRLLKFYKRGYTAPLDTIGAILARIADNADRSAIVNEAQLAAEFTRLLREVDPSEPRTVPAPISTPAAAIGMDSYDEEELPF